MPRPWTEKELALRASRKRKNRDYEKYPVTIGGAPKLDSPRRCQAKLKRKGKPCMKWALKGSQYCQFHGGRRANKHRVRVSHLPRFFSTHLKGTLQAVVEAAVSEEPTTQLELYEEIAIARRTVLDIAILYEAVISGKATKGDEKKTQIIAAELGLSLRSALKDIEGLVSAMARVEIARKDKISAHNINYVVNQVVRIAAEVFGDDLDKAEQFRALIADKLKVADNTGTVLDPTQDVLAMDSTIPYQHGKQ